MSWSVEFTQDTDVEGEGTVTVSNGGFSASRRLRVTNETKLSDFIADAKLRFEAYESKNRKIETIKQTILAKLGV